MAKIENTSVYPTVTPTASDLLIATDVSDNNKTVTFKVSDLLSGSTLQDLQSVLNEGNSATANMFLTGNMIVNGNLVPTAIQDNSGSLGVLGQVLTSTATGLQWSSVSNTQTLQQTLDNGNSSTLVDMNIDQGTINVTSGGVNLDNASNLSVGGVATFSSAVNLGTVLDFGATTSINDYSGSVGTAGQVLTVNAAGTGVEWSSAAGTTPSLQQVLNVGNTATNIGINMAGTGAFTTSVTNTMTLASTNTFSGTNTFTADIEVDGTIEDGGGSAGTAGQVLSSTGTGVQWVDAASATAATLQSVLAAGNTATEDINLTGDIDLTGQLYFQSSSTINAGGNIGVSGQVLTSTGGGLTWSDVSVNPTLDNVLTNGNSSAQNIVLTGSASVTAPTIIPTNIQDTLGTNGAVGYVLTSTATGIQWQAASGGSAVSSVSAGAAGTSTGTPLTISPTTGAVSVVSNAYAGGSNVGHVPAGGAAGQYLDGASGAWTALPSGGGTMSSFDITDGAANTETISDGNTISFLVGTPVFSAGTGMTATVSATDTVTFVNTGITNITGSADISVTIGADGQAALSFIGGGGSMSSWNIGDNSSTSAVNNGDTVNIIGGTNISSTLVGNNITLDSTGVSQIDIAPTVPNTLPNGGISVTNGPGGPSTITLYTYDGGANIGLVPSGGTASTVLAGDGSWVSNAAGMASFGIAGDSGTDTVDTTDNTLSILGTAPISTDVTATNNVTISHDTSGVAANSYAYPSSVTVTAEGHVSAITAGSAPGTMSLWRLGATSPAASFANINDGDYVLFAEGAGITTVRSGTGSSADPDQILITNTGVLDITGGVGISASASTGNVTITNDGVLDVSTTDGTFIDMSPTSSTSGSVTVTADLSATGTTDATTFLRGDNTWAVPTLAGNQVNTLTAGANLEITTGTDQGAGNYTGDVTIAYTGPTGSMSDFIVASDGSGTSQFGMNDGNTLNLNNGAGIDVVLSNVAGTKAATITNTGVTSLTSAGNGLSLSANNGAITIENTGVTSLVGGTDITVTQDGTDAGMFTIDYTGSGTGLASWNLAADVSSATIDPTNNDLEIIGGTGISTAISQVGGVYYLTINLNSFPISGTQNFIAKFDNPAGTSVGDSRIVDNGNQGRSIGFENTIDTIGYAISAGAGLNGFKLNAGAGYTSTPSFGVNTLDNTLNQNAFGRYNIVVTSDGLKDADPTGAAGDFESNTVVGARIGNTMIDESATVLVGFGVGENSNNGLTSGDVIIGALAAQNLNSAGGEASVIIGYQAGKNSGSGQKSAAVLIGSHAGYSGGNQSATVIGTNASRYNDDHFGSVIIGEDAASDAGYTAQVQSSVLIGFDVQNGTSGNQHSNSIVIGAHAYTNYDGSIVIGKGAQNTNGPNTIHIGSAAIPSGNVVTSSVSQGKYWEVFINGLPERILLA